MLVNIYIKGIHVVIYMYIIYLYIGLQFLRLGGTHIRPVLTFYEHCLNMLQLRNII